MKLHPFYEVTANADKMIKMDGLFINSSIVLVVI
jgi:hypothetical protein